MDKNGASLSQKKGETLICQVPSNFVASYGGTFPSKVTLGIQKFNDLYFFTHGCAEFGEEVNLQSRQLQKGKNKDKRRKTNSSHGGNKGSGDKKVLSFTKEIKKHHRHRMEFPNFFDMTNGKPKRGEIKLKDCEGRVWPVTIRDGCEHLAMSEGFCKFMKANNVVIGNTRSFVSSSSDTIDVQIVKEGTHKQALFEHAENVQVPKGGHENLKNESDHTKVPTSSVVDVRSGNEDGCSYSEDMDLGSD